MSPAAPPAGFVSSTFGHLHPGLGYGLEYSIHLKVVSESDMVE